MNSAVLDMTMDELEVCKLNDLVEGSGVCALLPDGQQVALFYLKGESRLFAIGNHDPLGKANVLSRGIVGDVRGEPVVASPLYKQHFSLLDGRCMEDETVRVPVYPVRLEGERVFLGLTPERTGE